MTDPTAHPADPSPEDVRPTSDAETPGDSEATDDLATIAWQFNEAVSLLREARRYVPEATGCAEDIDEGLPNIQTALEGAARFATMFCSERRGERLRELETSIGAEVEILDGNGGHYTGADVAGILRALLHVESDVSPVPLDGDEENTGRRCVRSFAPEPENHVTPAEAEGWGVCVSCGEVVNTQGDCIPDHVDPHLTACSAGSHCTDRSASCAAEQAADDHSRRCCACGDHLSAPLNDDVSPVPLDGEENSTPDPREAEHLRHMTDGCWHDDCSFCRRRREVGGTGVPATPEGGELDDLLAEHEFLLKPEMGGYVATRDAWRSHAIDLASALRRQRDEWHKAVDRAAGRIEWLERELAKARDTREEMFEGVITDAIHDPPGADDATVHIKAGPNYFADMLDVPVVVLRASTEGDSK